MGRCARPRLCLRLRKPRVSERVRAFVEGARSRCDEFREVGRTVAVDRAAEVAAAFRAGRVPTFETLPQLSHNARELLEAESRVAAAEIAASDLAGAESEAALAVTKARDELRQAAQSVMLAEADALAERIAALEGEALTLRVRLGGGSMCPIATMNLSLSATLAAVLQETDLMGDRFARDGRLWNGTKDAANGWRGYLDSLLADPDATPNFEPQTEAIAAE